MSGAAFPYLPCGWCCFTLLHLRGAVCLFLLWVVLLSLSLLGGAAFSLAFLGGVMLSPCGGAALSLVLWGVLLFPILLLYGWCFSVFFPAGCYGPTSFFWVVMLFPALLQGGDAVFPPFWCGTAFHLLFFLFVGKKKILDEVEAAGRRRC